MYRAVSRQRLGKHVPAAKEINGTMNRNRERNGVFYVVRAEML
jgi:hypothetical protein